MMSTYTGRGGTLWGRFVLPSSRPALHSLGQARCIRPAKRRCAPSPTYAQAPRSSLGLEVCALSLL